MIFPYQQYDIIIISNYLNREVLKLIPQALKPNSNLYIQTFLPIQENAPNNQSVYLVSGELNKLLPILTTEVYGESWLGANRYAWYIGNKVNK